MIGRLWGVACYESRLQVRSLVFWLGVVLVAVMTYSEVVAATVHDVTFHRDYLANPGQMQLSEPVQAYMEDLTAEGMPTEGAALGWADRTAIVISFALLFAAAFVLERDRLTKTYETIAGRPVRSWEYVAGKYLGVVLPMFAVALTTMLVAMATNLWAQARLGHEFTPAAFLRPSLILFVTVVYVPALVLAAAAAFGRGALVIPPFLVYLFGAGISPALGGQGGFRIDLFRFIIRSDAREAFRQALAGGLLLENRLLYLGLTVAFVGLAALAYDRRRRIGG